MKLKEMSDVELSGVLNERILEFNSYRVNAKGFSNEAKTILVKKETPLEGNADFLEAEDILVESEDLLFVRKEESGEEIQITTNIPEKAMLNSGNKKSNTGALEATKSYNERMRAGRFGKRQRR